MTSKEQEQWADSLAPSLRGQALIIVDLLRHECEDRMSLDDRLICRNQLNRIERILGLQSQAKLKQKRIEARRMDDEIANQLRRVVNHALADSGVR